MQPDQYGPNQNYGYPSYPQPPKRRGLTNLSKPALFGGLGMLLLIGIVLLILSSGASPAQTQLLDSSRIASEMTRVSGLMLENGQTSPDTANIASTVRSTTLDSQRQIEEILGGKYGYEISDKERKTFVDSELDSRLTEAAQNNRLDETYLDVIKTQLEALNSQIAKVHADSKDDQVKSRLDDVYKNNQTLLDLVENEL